MRDTTPAGDDRYHQLLRARLPHERLEAAMGLSRAVRALAEAGIRARHPDADDAEVRIRLAARMYGRGVAARLFGTIPDDAV
jgi:hypothetical protein